MMRPARLGIVLAAAFLAAQGAAASAAEAVPPAASASPDVTIWRLPGAASAMRIAGEDGTLTVPVFVPAASAGASRGFS